MLYILKKICFLNLLHLTIDDTFLPVLKKP